MVHELNSFLTGWVTYFRYAECRTHLGRVDSAEVALRAAEAAETGKAIADFLLATGGVWQRLVASGG